MKTATQFVLFTYGSASVAAGISLSLLSGCLRDGAEEPLEPQDVPQVAGARIRFSERFAKHIGLKTAPVSNASVVPSLSVVGTVTFDPQHVAHIGTRLRGIVREVRHFEGDVVKKNEILATVDSPELGEAQAAVTSLKAELEAAQQNVKREGSLVALKLTTLKESEQAWSLFERYRALLHAAEHKVISLAGTKPTEGQPIGIHTITSPLDGTVFERRISKGHFIDGDYTAFVVGTLDRVWVELSVFEQAVHKIRIGDEVELRPLGSRAKPLRGQVARDVHIVQAPTRSAPIRVQVDNRDRLLRPGQAVDANIRTSAAAEPVGPVIPTSSIVYIDGSPAVFVVDAPDSVHIGKIELGASDGEHVAVKNGLVVGDQVVVEGTFELKSELYR
jgi:cobalt-zinc-cadmium efflux system membrane fusion protein